jgi:hypothetical protein
MNYSGSTKRNIIEKKEVSVRPLDTQIVNDESRISEEEAEMKRVIEIFEKTKEDDPDLFHKLMMNIKKIMEIFSQPQCSRDEMKLLDETFTEVENVNKDFLFWCVNKGIKMATIENKNLDVVHFLLVKKTFKLNNKSIHKKILIEYFNSLSDIDLLECDEESLNTYMAILEILIFYAEVDINEVQEGIENTPLHIAVLFKQVPFIMALAKNKNCKINFQNKNGDTALDFAISRYGSGEDEMIYEEIIKILTIHGAVLNEDHL